MSELPPTALAELNGAIGLLNGLIDDAGTPGGPRFPAADALTFLTDAAQHLAEVHREAARPPGSAIPGSSSENPDGHRLTHASIRVTAQTDSITLHLGGCHYPMSGSWTSYKDDVDVLMRLSATAMRGIELLRDPAVRAAAANPEPEPVRWLATE